MPGHRLFYKFIGFFHDTAAYNISVFRIFEGGHIVISGFSVNRCVTMLHKHCKIEIDLLRIYKLIPE